MTYKQLHKLEEGDIVKIRDLPRLRRYLERRAVQRRDPANLLVPYGIPHNSGDVLWDKDGVGICVEIVRIGVDLFCILPDDSWGSIWQDWIFHPILIEKRVRNGSHISDEEYAQLF